MTLFIACLLIAGFQLDSSLYGWAVILWFFHLVAHSSSSTKK